jgi:PPOX class probable F420-dependent enzyme
MSGLEDLESQKYISLETYKKNNQPVKTPVWFVINNDLIYVITREGTGKVKRIKNNPQVKLASCTFGGKPTGEWFSGKASKVLGEESDKAIKLRKKKYGFRATIAQFASRGKGDLVVFSIKLE